MFSSTPSGRFMVGGFSRPGVDSNGTRANEDSLALNEKKGVFGIFDGNGKTKHLILESMNLSLEDWTWARQKLGVGYDISDQFDPAELSVYLSENMPSAFYEEMIDEEENLEHRLRNLVGMFHNKVRDRCLMGSASTATLVYVDETGDNMTVISCGDTRAVLCRTERALQLTKDQKSDLNIGTEGFDQRQVTIHQERIDKANDSFVFLASDGVYNAFERGNDEIIDIIIQKQAEGMPAAKIAKHVVDAARKKEEETTTTTNNNISEGEEGQMNKIDDMTILIIFLNETLHLTPIEITSDGRGALSLKGRTNSFWMSVFVVGVFAALGTAVVVFVGLKFFSF